MHSPVRASSPGPWFERHSVRRPLAERLGVRFPALTRRLASLGGRAWALLPASSATRRRLLEHGVHRSYAAFNRQDADVLRMLHHRDCVFDMSHVPDWPESPSYYGHDGLLRYMRDWHGQWQDVHYEPVHVSEPEKGTVLIESHVRAVGRSSGLSVEAAFFQVGVPRHGLVWSVANYRDREEALRAATASGG